MLKALKPLEAELGVTFAIGRGTFDTLAWRFNMDVTEGDGEAILAEQEATFKRYADEYGLKPEDYGVAFPFARKLYRCVGLNLGKPKYAVQVQRLDNGKIYGMKAEDVEASLRFAKVPLLSSADWNVLIGGREADMADERS